jgi:hypothetical protein
MIHAPPFSISEPMHTHGCTGVAGCGPRLFQCHKSLQQAKGIQVSVAAEMTLDDLSRQFFTLDKGAVF